MDNLKFPLGKYQYQLIQDQQKRARRTRIDRVFWGLCICTAIIQVILGYVIESEFTLIGILVIIGIFIGASIMYGFATWHEY